MPEFKQRHVPEDELSDDLHDQVFRLMLSLQEFEESCIIYLLAVKRRLSPMHKRFRLIRNAHAAYLHGYYVEQSGAIVLTLLERIGRPDLADSTRALLLKDVGGTTLGQHLADHRNIFIAHPTFTEARERHFFQLDSNVVADPYARLIQRTVALFRLLRRLYPGMSDLLDELEPPVDNFY